MKYFLRDLAEIGAGQGAPQGDHNYCEDGLPFVKAGNLQELSSGGSINDIQKVSDEVAKSHKLKLYPEGTVLFAKSGMSCLKGYVYVLPMNAYVVSHLACITPKDDISEYLRLYFTFHRPNQLVKDAAYPSISLTDIGNLEIDIKDEQTRGNIVSTLNSIEEVIELRKQELQSFDDLIKARFVEMFGDAVINPYGYEQITIGEACTLINGRAFKPSDWGKNGLPIVRIQNLNDTNAPFNYYDGQVSEQHLIDSGMLLFSWSGTPGTSFGAFMWNRGPGALNQHIFKVIPKLDFDLDYLRYAMNGQLSTIIAKAHGGVGLQHITKAELDKIFLLHPNMQEQKQFATFVAQIDKSKSAVQKALEQARLLFDSLMQRYFG